jgi:hypothetical protein
LIISVACNYLDIARFAKLLHKNAQENIHHKIEDLSSTKANKEIAVYIFVDQKNICQVV